MHQHGYSLHAQVLRISFTNPVSQERHCGCGPLFSGKSRGATEKIRTRYQNGVYVPSQRTGTT